MMPFRDALDTLAWWTMTVVSICVLPLAILWVLLFGWKPVSPSLVNKERK